MPSIITLIGPAVTDHDTATMSEAATEQDLYGLRTEMAKGFAMIDSHFIAFRAEMATGFATCLYEVKKTIMRTYFATFLAIVALLGIDRWWN